MFMSVEMANGRLDCGTQGFPIEAGGRRGPSANKDRFRGVRIFDISDIKNPKQVGSVQTCRGSHTHTVVPDLKDKNNVYIYVSGTSFVRPGEELAGCSGQRPDADPNTSLFRIEVIKVPLARPQDAKVVSEPRLFKDAETGKINALTDGGSRSSGRATRPVETDQCHDITVYPELGLAAGACSGNGILIDISDPVNPKRIDAVNDQNYAYWHSASFSNDGKTIVFTDEWGGGMAPRCRENDPSVWGANALFTLKDRKLVFENYYKIPAAQGDTENCVAHNGSLVPVPGRDIKVQAWYQGGISVMDFTDPKNPIETRAHPDGVPLAERDQRRKGSHVRGSQRPDSGENRVVEDVDRCKCLRRSARAVEGDVGREDLGAERRDRQCGAEQAEQGEPCGIGLDGGFAWNGEDRGRCDEDESPRRGSQEPVAIVIGQATRSHPIRVSRVGWLPNR